MRIEITLPVFNEMEQLANNVIRLNERVASLGRHPIDLHIVDNGSDDGTQDIGRRLERELSRVRYTRIENKGRGLALRSAWIQSGAEIVSYMDIDLSANLDCLEPLLTPIISGQVDLMIGSRLLPGARVTRGWKREILSRGFNWFVRQALKTGISDHQCGFKAFRTSAARIILPQIENNGWFFDTEMIALSQNRGLRVGELPIIWSDDPGSSVQLVATIIEDVRETFRLRSRMRRALVYDFDRARVEKDSFEAAPAREDP